MKLVKDFIAACWKREGVFLALVLLIALLVRLDFVIAANFVIDSDEAIVGLMAKHITEGTSIPVFYYGQHYMGSFEPLIVALVFQYFGISIAALKIVPIIFSLYFVLLVYALGIEVGGRMTGRMAALLCAFPPSALVIWSAKARGGFIEICCIGALALLLTVRMLSRDKVRVWRTFLVGLLLGFGWWVNNQIIYFILPIGLLFVAQVQREALETAGQRFWLLLTHLVLGLTAFLIGGFPFWKYNFENDFISFAMFQGGSPSDVAEHLQGLIDKALPILLGARGFWQDFDRFPHSTSFVAILYGFLIVGIVAHHCWLLLTKKKGAVYARGWALTALLILAASTVSVFIFSSFGYLSSAPRYLLPLYTSIFPLAAYGVIVIYRHFRAGGITAGFALVLVHVLSCYLGGRAIPGEPFVHKGERVQRNHGELIQWLDENEVSWVRTNYWIGYRLAFETGEKVRFILFQKPGQTRIDAYDQLGKSFGLEKMPYVLVPSQARIVRQALSALGYEFKEASISGYTIIFEIIPPFELVHRVPREALSAMASVNSESAALAVDGSYQTRWGSATPQAPGMEFRVVFPRPIPLAGFHYEMGEWIHDYPRGLRVDGLDANGKPFSLISDSDFRAIRYLAEYDSGWTYYLPHQEISEIRFYQSESHQLFDWSIAELEFYSNSPIS